MMPVLGTLRESLFARLSQKFFYGWTILGVAFIGLFASGPGQSHTFSVFLEPISEDLGLSRTALGTAYGLATLAAAFFLPRIGRAIDRHGPRRVIIWIVLGLGLACMFFGAAANYLWLIVGFGILRFLGQGSLMLSCANIVSQWFQKKRGFALGLMASGFGLSMAIHPPLGQFLIDTIGWRQAWVTLGLLTWLIMLPPVLLLAFDRPEERGLRPDGEIAHDSDKPPAAITGLTRAEALRSPAFYICVTAFFSISMLVTSLHFFQVSVLTLNGIDPALAARSFPISATVMLLAMPLVGRLFDLFKTRHVFALALAVQAASLVSITFADSLATMLLYAVIFGLNNAFSMTMFGYLWPRYFGRKHVGEIQGTGQMVLVVGASLGPLPIGLAFDHLESPLGVIQLLALFPLACAIATQFLRTPEGVDGFEHLD